MHVTRDDLDRFHHFAVSLVSRAETDLTWHQLFEFWRLENPSVDEHHENIEAIRQSLESMHAGRKRPLSDFDSEFRQRYGIADDA
jgi:hypothetical protein